MGGISLETGIRVELHRNFSSGEKNYGFTGVLSNVDRVARGIVVEELNKVNKPAIRVGLFNRELP